MRRGAGVTDIAKSASQVGSHGLPEWREAERRSFNESPAQLDF